jgi:hypothetical protein
MSESKADYAEDEVWEAKQDDLFARGEGGAKEAFSILILDDSPYNNAWNAWSARQDDLFQCWDHPLVARAVWIQDQSGNKGG